MKAMGFDQQITRGVPTESRLLTTLKKKAIERTIENGENASRQHFLLFPQCMLLYEREGERQREREREREIIILAMFDMSSASAFNMITYTFLSFCHLGVLYLWPAKLGSMTFCSQ